MNWHAGYAVVYTHIDSPKVFPRRWVIYSGHSKMLVGRVSYLYLPFSIRWNYFPWPSSITSHIHSINKQRWPGAADISELVFLIVKAVEADWDTFLISLFNAIYVDKALVLLLIALDHLLGENVQVAQFKLCIELIVGASLVKLRGLMNNDLADFVYKDALLGRKETHSGSYLQAQPMDELLQV